MFLLSKNLSIKKLTLIIFTVMYIIFLLITGMNLYSYSKYEFNKTEKLICNYNTSLSQQINQKLNNVIDVSKYPLIIPEIDKVHNILANESEYNINDYNYLLYLCEMMLIQNDSINGAYIYNLKGDGVYSTRNSSYNTLKNPTKEQWFLDCVNSETEYQICSDVTSSNIFASNNTEAENLIAVTRKIINVKTQKITGVLLLTIPTSEVLSLDKNDLPFNDQIISLYDVNNNKLLSTSDLEHKISSVSNYLSKSVETPAIEYVNDYLDHIICYNKVSSNLALINSIPISNAYHIDSLYLFSLSKNVT